MKKIIVLAVFVGLGIFVTSCVLAARAQPGQTLYGFKARVAEPARKFTYPNQIGKGEYELLLVNRRFSELELALAKSDIALAEEVFAALVPNVQSLLARIRKIVSRQQYPLSDYLASALGATLAAHLQVLEEVLPEGVLITAPLDYTLRTEAEVDALLSDIAVAAEDKSDRKLFLAGLTERFAQSERDILQTQEELFQLEPVLQPKIKTWAEDIIVLANQELKVARKSQETDDYVVAFMLANNVRARLRHIGIMLEAAQTFPEQFQQ